MSSILVITDNGYSCSFGSMKEFAGVSRDFVRKHGKITKILKNCDLTNTTPCPDCGAKLILEEGCKKCYQCGFSAC